MPPKTRQPQPSCERSLSEMILEALELIEDERLATAGRRNPDDDEVDAVRTPAKTV
jgi:hypothetical protein